MKHALALLIALLLTPLAAVQAAVALPDYAPAPADNPLKGFAPYAGQAKEFPHSLEFQYFALKDLMTGPNTFDWQPLEELPFVWSDLPPVDSDWPDFPYNDTFADRGKMLLQQLRGPYCQRRD